MSTETGLPTSPPHAQERFELLQEKLVPLWKSIQAMSQDPQTIVVVPSMSLDSLSTNSKGRSDQAYEERYLFLLLLLRQPNARLIYVTSEPILDSVIDYYLNLLPGVIPSNARPRLFTIAAHDAGPDPLSLKLLKRPKLMETIRSLILDPDRAHLVPYNTTELERDLAVRLGIPMFGADPRFFDLGTKTGCRRLFEEEGVPHPLGIEDLHTEEQVIDAIAGLRAQKPELDQLIIKLNEGVSGHGNAIIRLGDLPEPGADGEREAILAAMHAYEPELEGAVYEEYMQKLDERGGVIEERIVGTVFESPSVQMRATPLGDLELLSTHDQMLGGASGQTYLGCIFPADPGYAVTITREAAKIGKRLAKEGVMGRFALDFIAVKNDAGEWETYAIEINLRKGGTTHPFLTLQFLTDGKYDADSGIFTAPSGNQKHFVASDHVDSEDYKGLTPDDLFDIVVRHGLHFDQSRQTGAVFHMIRALTTSGFFGITAVGDTPEEARQIYDKAIECINEEAGAAMTERPLPEV